MWVTEYNIFDYNTTANKPGVVVGTWAHALLFAQQTFYMMSSPRPTTVSDKYTLLYIYMVLILGDNGALL